MWKSGSDRAWVVYTQFVADRFDLGQADRNNRTNYDTVDVERAVCEPSGMMKVSVELITISWRGCLAKRSTLDLMVMGLTPTDMAIIATKALTWLHGLHF